jgi:hypothetical protein
MKERRFEDELDESGDGVLGEKDIISDVCGFLWESQYVKWTSSGRFALRSCGVAVVTGQ